MGILKDAGFVCYEPRGAYYIMTDIGASDSRTTSRSRAIS